MSFRLAVVYLFLVHFHYVSAGGSQKGKGTPPGEDRSHWIKAGKETLKSILEYKDVDRPAKNILFFVGDGYGLPSIFATRVLKGQLQGNPGEETVLTWENWKNVGLVKTYNSDVQIGDSAGTGIAYLTGVKGNKGCIGVDNSVKRRNCKTYRKKAHTTSIAIEALAAGKSIGLITNTRITHATPGNVYAHTCERNWENNADIPDTPECAEVKDIALQFVENAAEFKVVFGGGLREFIPQDQNTTFGKPGLRKKGTPNLITEWEKYQKTNNVNYKVVYNKQEMDSIDPNNNERILGLFADNHMAYDGERPSTEPSLGDMVLKALSILKRNDKGYLLVVEGGVMDIAAHNGRAKRAINDGVAFEEAVESAFKVINKETTLITVTADHSQTLSVGGEPSRGNPIFGFSDEGLALDGKPYTSISFANGMGSYFEKDKPVSRPNLTEEEIDTWTYRQAATIPLVDETHGGEDVAIYANGPMSHLFRGVFEQNYVAVAIKYAACIGEDKSNCAGERIYLMQGTASSLKQNLCMMLISILVTVIFHK